METRPDNLVDLIWGHRVTAVIYTAARLNIADHIVNGITSLHGLATATGVDEQVLQRLLFALVTIGICELNERGEYSLTQTGSTLAASAEKSLKAWAIFEGELLCKSWHGLLDSVTTGKTDAELLGSNNWFEHMARTPKDVAIFDAAMVSLTRLATDEILAAYDFSKAGTLMDVGGGSGELIGAILGACKTMQGIVFDQPGCAARAQDHMQKLKIADRCKFVAGDFFAAVPAGADTIVMKSILHDWTDERCNTIIRNCGKALGHSGQLLIIERLLPEKPALSVLDRSHALSDLNMLRGPGGAERTAAAYERLLKAGGFRVARVVPAGRFGVIEAVKTG